MKIYIFENVLKDHFPGMCVVCAESVEQAVKLSIEYTDPNNHGYFTEEFENEALTIVGYETSETVPRVLAAIFGSS